MRPRRTVLAAAVVLRSTLIVVVSRRISTPSYRCFWRWAHRRLRHRATILRCAASLLTCHHIAADSVARAGPEVFRRQYRTARAVAHAGTVLLTTYRTPDGRRRRIKRLHFSRTVKRVVRERAISRDVRARLGVLAAAVVLRSTLIVVVSRRISTPAAARPSSRRSWIRWGVRCGIW